MADRKNFFYDQEVTEGELDTAFDQMETADWNQQKDAGVKGVREDNFAVHPTSPASMSVRIAGSGLNDPPGTGVDKIGRRLISSAASDVNVMIDENSNPITLPSAGNEKWVSVFVAHNRTGSDPREDGNRTTIQFQQTEGVTYKIVSSTEAVIGTNSKPALKTEELLLADIQLTNGMTTITANEISMTRREGMRRPDYGSQVEIGKALVGRIAPAPTPRILPTGYDVTTTPPGEYAEEHIITAWGSINANGLPTGGTGLYQTARVAMGVYQIIFDTSIAGLYSGAVGVAAISMKGGVLCSVPKPLVILNASRVECYIYCTEAVSGLFVDGGFTILLLSKYED